MSLNYSSSSIQSPYIVFFFGACLDPKLCMVMELCSRGSLFHVLNDPKIEIGWGRLFSFATQMTKGLDCLHSFVPHVVHRDFKSLNIMVSMEFHEVQ
jgi:serine/threonine protein kinase